MEPLPWYRIAAPIVFVAMLAGICLWKNLPRFRAMLLGIAMLSLYGMVQDQVSVRLCPEYFTIYHNPIPGLTEPTLLGIAWGFLGAWWGGALLGYSAGICATAGKSPPWPVSRLIVPMLVVIAFVAAVAAICGFAVQTYLQGFAVTVNAESAEAIPLERRRNVVTVACYHVAAYASAILGSVVLCLWIARKRSMER